MKYKTLNPTDITAIAHIKDTQTGKIVDKDTMVWVWPDEDKYDPYMWEEGNYSCDCNRGIFWGLDYSASKCDIGRFLVNLEVDGEIIYSEYGEQK